MKILKTSALAAILACASLSANATYDDSSEFTIELATATALSINFNSDDSTILFDNVIDGDQIDADVDVIITGAEYVGASSASVARSIECTLEDEQIDDSNSVTYALSFGGYEITEYTFELDGCDQESSGHTNVMTITSTAIANTTAGTSYTTTELSFAASYVTNTSIASYN